MTREELEGLTFLDRPIKPVALGIVVFMITLTVFNLREDGIFGDTILATLLALMAFTSTLCLVFGWFGRIQVMAEAGLLIAAVTYVIHAVFALLIVGPTNQTMWLSIGAGIISGGSFLLERWDTHRNEES